MTFAIIIQARMASSRLPGKVLLDLAGRTVLSHVVGRCRAIRNADVVCCAVSENRDSDIVAQESERCGATVFRGSELDVLDRYYHAAVSLNAQVVLRVTSDCPLIDPQIAEKVVDLLIKEKADFATNNLPPSWPHGLDCEAFTFSWLERAFNEATDSDEREHVSPFMRRHPDARIVNLEGPGGKLIDQRWTLDYPEDLEFLRALLSELPSLPQIPSMATVLEVLKKRSDIFDLNRIRTTTRKVKGTDNRNRNF